MITFDRVSKRYGRVTAVGELSLNVASGEIVVLAGPSGCGKTTSLTMIIEASAARGCKKPRRISFTERHGGQHARGVSARVDADPSRRDDRALCAWHVAMHDCAGEAVSLAQEWRANRQHRLFRLLVERPVRIDAGVNEQIVAVHIGKREAFEKAQMFGRHGAPRAASDASFLLTP